MSNIIHLDVFSGTDRTLTLYARDPSNVAVSLSGKTLTGYFGRPPLRPDCSDAIFTKSGTITDAASGTYTITIEDSDTTYLDGDYEYQVKTVDGSSLVAVVTMGRFRVRSVLTT